jgi:hypothetical protein
VQDALFALVLRGLDALARGAVPDHLVDLERGY